MRAAFVENVNGGKRKRPRFQPIARLREVDEPFVPRGRQSRQRIRRAIQGADRVGPQADPRGSRVDDILISDTAQWDDIVRNDRTSSRGERRRQRRFSGPETSDDGDDAVRKGDGAGVQAGDAAAPEREREDRAEQVGCDVVDRPRLGPRAPRPWSVRRQSPRWPAAPLVSSAQSSRLRHCRCRSDHKRCRTSFHPVPSIS